MKDLKQNLLRYHQREDIKSEIENADKMLPHAKGDQRGPIIASRSKLKKQLEEQSPVPLTGKEKDTLNSLEKRLRERITTNMPTEEVMRKNPAGAVDWHQRWEKQNKPLIRMWKNVRIQLQPDNQDRDLANIERYRPSGQTDRMRTDAQIPGLMSYGSVPEENWPFEAPQNTALAQVQKRYDEDEAANDVNAAITAMETEEAQQAELDENPPLEKMPLSVEEKAILVQRLAKGREALAKKRAEQKQLDEAIEAVPVSPMAD
jgi:hypothetical protein